MPFITSADEARSARKAIEVRGETYYVSPYVGSAPTQGIYVPGNEVNDDRLPQAFLVEQPAGAVTKPHFHDHEQFQVFISGEGELGKKPARPVALHYAGGHTPYGPITSGKEGIVYFTLRSRWDAGAKYMPESRDKLNPVKRKHRLAEGIELPGEDVMRDAGDGVVREILDVANDGTCAYLFIFGANRTGQLETPIHAGGQYAIILAGSAIDDDRHLPRLSGLYRFRNEAPLSIAAGHEGVAVLLMQFSRDDPA